MSTAVITLRRVPARRATSPWAKLPRAIGGAEVVALSSTPCSWGDVAAGLYHVFQPILQARTGRCLGYEALLRGWDRFGFCSPPDVLDAALEDGVLGELEAVLYDVAVESFCALPGWQEAKLFLNLSSPSLGQAALMLGQRTANRVQIVHEISERHPIPQGLAIDDIVALFGRHGAGIALDDFGVGVSGLKLLHDWRPDYVKIDRYFVSGVDQDERKRAIVGNLVGFAHALGIGTVAEGVETAPEFYACRDLGCDFLQGFLFGQPSRDLDSLRVAPAIVTRLNAEDRRRSTDVRVRVEELVEPMPPLEVDSPKSVLLDYFGQLRAPAIVPVIDRQRRPLGLVRERDLKPFVYSQFGSDLLRNKAFRSSLREFVVACPVCDINTPLERVVEAFSTADSADGVIIVEGGAYVGLLSSHALLRLVHERKLAAATDQNPLTRLPGNNAIGDRIRQAIESGGRHALVYLDFDNFKPFNDHYGFRQGDRAILMFSERLKVLAVSAGGFAGHIGGDDFFLILSGVREPHLRQLLADLVLRFRLDAESLYSAEVRAAGWFDAKDRDGNPRKFPLLGVSAVALLLGPERGRDLRSEQIIATIADHKGLAKANPDRLCFVRL